MSGVNLPLPCEAYTGDEPFAFVSYAHSDAEHVYPEILRLYSMGYRIWFDEGIDPGNEWPEEIANAIAKAAQFIVFITANAVDSRNVRNEINFALSLKKPFLAIHLSKTELPPGMALQTGSVQAVLKWRMDEAGYCRRLERVLTKDLIQSDVPGREMPVVLPIEPPPPPKPSPEASETSLVVITDKQGTQTTLSHYKFAIGNILPGYIESGVPLRQGESSQTIPWKSIEKVEFKEGTRVTLTLIDGKVLEDVVLKLDSGGKPCFFMGITGLGGNMSIPLEKLRTLSRIPGTLTIDKEVENLINQLKSKNLRERLNAIEGLKNIGLPLAEPAIPFLAAMTDDRESDGGEPPGLRAAMTLADFGSVAVTALINCLQFKERIWYASRALGRTKDPRAIEALINAADLEPSSIVADALICMGEAAIYPLLKALKDKRPSVRAVAVYALCVLNTDDVRVVPALLSAMEDEDIQVRQFLSEKIDQKVENPDIFEKLLVKSKDERQVKIRENYVCALGKSEDEHARIMLTEILKNDSAATVRVKACHALGNTKSVDTVPDLIMALSDSDARVHEAAASTLTKMTKKNLGADVNAWILWWEQCKVDHEVRATVAPGPLSEIAAEELREGTSKEVTVSKEARESIQQAVAQTCISSRVVAFGGTEIVDKNSAVIWQNLHRQWKGEEIPALCMFLQEHHDSWKDKCAALTLLRNSLRSPEGQHYGDIAVACICGSNLNVSPLLLSLVVEILNLSQSRREDKWQSLMNAWPSLTGNYGRLGQLMASCAPRDRQKETRDALLDTVPLAKREDISGLLEGIVATTNTESRMETLSRLLDLLHALPQNTYSSIATAIRTVMCSEARVDIGAKLTTVLRSVENYYDLQALLKLLQEMDYRECLPVLREILESGNSGSVAAVVSTIALWRDQESVEPLRETIERFMFVNLGGYLDGMIQALYTLEGSSCASFLAKFLRECSPVNQKQLLKSSLKNIREKDIRSAASLLATTSADVEVAQLARDYVAAKEPQSS